MLRRAPERPLLGLLPVPDVTVVISTLGNYGGLRRVLDTYERQTAPAGSFEVIVAVDAADPDPEAAAATAAGRPYPVRVLRGGRPGLSANRNAGIAAAAAPLLLFTDNDTLASPRLVAEHLAWHRRHPEPEVGVLGHVRWAREIGVTPFMHWLDYGIQFDYPNIEGVEAGWGRFYGANSSVKRELAQRVGGFDEVNTPYLYDDLDFAYRASALGFRLLYNRRAEVEHLRRMDIAYWRARAAQLARAERAFCAKHPEIPPYFRNMFDEAVHQPPAKGRGRHLIKWIPRRFPWLGERAWRSADLYFRQALAPPFLAAWEAAASEPAPPGDAPVAPYLLEFDATSSSGS